MAIVVITEDLEVIKYHGESTDTKPVLSEKNNGSSFFELDTGAYYVWHIDGWRQE